MDVAELLVSDHFVLKLNPLLALVFEFGEYFSRHDQVLEVHGDLSKRLHDPVDAVKRLLFFLPDHI